MSDALDIDLSTITPEELAALVKSVDDQTLRDGVKAVGTEAALDRCFEGMAERFRSDVGKAVDATVNFHVDDDGAQHPYHVTMKDGTCTARQGVGEGAKATIRTDVVSFMKLITGNATGPGLFMKGKIKLEGDMMFAARFDGFFDKPKS